MVCIFGYIIINKTNKVIKIIVKIDKSVNLKFENFECDFSICVFIYITIKILTINKNSCEIKEKFITREKYFLFVLCLKIFLPNIEPIEPPKIVISKRCFSFILGFCFIALCLSIPKQINDINDAIINTNIYIINTF